MGLGVYVGVCEGVVDFFEGGMGFILRVILIYKEVD